MKCFFALCLSILFIVPTWAEEKQYLEKDDFQKEVSRIQSSLKDLKKIQADTSTTISSQNDRIDKLSNRLTETENRLGKSVSDVGQYAQDAQGKVRILGDSLSKNSIYGFVAISLTVLLGSGAVIFLRRRMSAADSALEDRIKSARSDLEAETIKLDSRLVELLQNQLKVQHIERTNSNQAQATEIEVNHVLPLRVAEEIIRMRGRLESLPPDTKGLKPLIKSLERLEEDFNQQGYEIEEMLNKPFDDGLNVKARFIPSDDLKPGEQLITKIIKPQINYKGTSIQMAEIEVSTGG
jgi:chromosome segregation ATPase